jgi:hypothetical protein
MSALEVLNDYVLSQYFIHQKRSKPHGAKPGQGKRRPGSFSVILFNSISASPIPKWPKLFPLVIAVVEWTNARGNSDQVEPVAMPENDDHSYCELQGDRCNG